MRFSKQHLEMTIGETYTAEKVYLILRQLEELENNEEETIETIASIIDKTYEEGFQDGVNEGGENE